MFSFYIKEKLLSDKEFNDLYKEDPVFHSFMDSFLTGQFNEKSIIEGIFLICKSGKDLKEFVINELEKKIKQKKDYKL